MAKVSWTEKDLVPLRQMLDWWRRNGGSLVSQPTVRTIVPATPLLARLVDAGPAGESDYTDNRYWFRTIRDVGTDTLETSLPTFNFFPADHPCAIHATAVNLNDMDNATHSLAVASATAEPTTLDKKNTIVMIWPIFNMAQGQPARRYVFFGGLPPVPDLTKVHALFYDDDTNKIYWGDGTATCP